MMPWSSTNYPASMKNLDAPVREKAIEIANTLIEERYDTGRAIAIATAQAKRWAEHDASKHSERDLHVVPHPEGWAVRRTNADRASAVLLSQTEARDRATEMARKEAVAVIVHNADGQIEDTIDFAGEAF